MKFVLKNLFRRKLRTLFSVLGVGVGVSIMVALFSISDDLVGQIAQAFETQRGDIAVMQATAEELESDVPLDFENTLQQIKGVKSVSPMIAALLRTENDFDDRPAILYYGVTQNSPIIPHMEMLEGQTISDDDPNGVVFGWKAYEVLKEKMGDKAPKVGGELNFLDVVTSDGFKKVFGKPDNWEQMTEYGKKMWALMRLTKDLGIHPDAIKEETPAEYETRTGQKAPPPRPMNIMGLPYDDDQYTKWLHDRYDITYDPKDPVKAYQMKMQLHTRGVCRTGILVQDASVFFHLKIAQLIKGKHERTEIVKQKIDGKLKDVEIVHRPSCTVMLLTVDSEGLTREQHDAEVIRVRDEINQKVDALRAIRSADILERHKEVEFFEKFGLVISLIAALAGAIGILNTMTLTVYERTREIGLLLAVGWSRLRVLSNVMLEGLLLSVLGGLAGVLFGFLEVQAARTWFNLDGLSGALNVQRSLHALALAFGIGFLATLYPAIRAALMTPIEALRHE
ncbi:MAG: ABC transporter permease [Planctomycetes bacterium]|nr:ABC transporter permease [Planctomycetota bacterium]